MRTLKRPPPDTLLPLRAPKQPRLAEGHARESDKPVGHTEGTANVCQAVMEVLKRGFELTIGPFLPGASEECPCSLDATDAYGPADSPRDASPPQSPPETLVPRPVSPPPPRHPSRPPIPSEFKSGTRPQDTLPSNHRASSSSVPRKLSHRLPKAPLVEVQIPPVASSSSPPQLAIPPRARRKSEPNVKARLAVLQSSVRPAPAAFDARPQAAPLTQPWLSVGLANHVNGRKKYIVREHIYAKQHKAKVRETRERDMEEMEKTLYERGRRGGFTGDFSTFKGYLRYRAQLERLEPPLGAFSPSASLTDLRLPEQEPLTKDFLQRALDKADASLASPSPPKLDAPAFEKILTTQRALDAEIERRIRPKLPTSLPPEDEARVDKLFSQKGIISRCNREQVTAIDLSRLRPNQWLNDEIINFYGQMIMARAEASQQNAGSNGRKKPLNIHYFNTFFWSKLGAGYKKSKLARWTKKIDIFAKDVILIPINHNNSHWTAAAINFHKRRIESYDSMGMQRRNVFKLLREYLNAEHLDKRGRPFDFTGWEDYVLEDTPQQENGFDCGVFTCQFLETLARGEEKFLFKQANMPYMRRRMALEIGNTKLHHDL